MELNAGLLFRIDSSLSGCVLLVLVMFFIKSHHSQNKVRIITLSTVTVGIWISKLLFPVFSLTHLETNHLWGYLPDFGVQACRQAGIICSLNKPRMKPPNHYFEFVYCRVCSFCAACLPLRGRGLKEGWLATVSDLRSQEAMVIDGRHYCAWIKTGRLAFVRVNFRIWHWKQHQDAVEIWTKSNLEDWTIEVFICVGCFKKYDGGFERPAGMQVVVLGGCGFGTRDVQRNLAIASFGVQKRGQGFFPRVGPILVSSSLKRTIVSSTFTSNLMSLEKFWE